MFNIKNKILFFLIIFIFGILFLSCKGEPIFAAIEQEVKLKDASVKGTVRNIVKIGDTLYTSDGRILKKSTFNTGEWSVFYSPSANCTSLATDGTNLFASFVDYYMNDFWVKVYNGSSWETVPNSKGIQVVMGNGSVIGYSISYENEIIHDKAVLYSITASGVSKLKDLEVSEGKARVPRCAGNNFYATSSGVFNSSNGAEITSEIAPYVIVEDYFITGSSVYKKGDYEKSISHGLSGPNDACIITLDGVKRLLISGTHTYTEIALDETDITKSVVIPVGKSVTFNGSTLNSTTPPGYKEQYESISLGRACNKIFAFANGSGYFVYLGINDPNFGKYTGLWGFYNPGQMEWNRE